MKTIPLLNYRVTGTGPTIVLLHGYLLSGQYWQQLTEIIGSTYRVISLDLLGFGNSPKPHYSRYDYEAQLQSIKATLAHLKVTTPFTLVGHSMGALISLRYATRYPEAVKKLLLANMPIMLSRGEAKREIFGTRPWYRFGLSPGGHQIVWMLFRSLAGLKLLPKTAVAELAGRLSYIFQSSAAARLRSFRRIILDATIEADLRAVTARTIILSGMNDRAIYMYNLTRLVVAKHISLHNVIGDHHLPLKQPELLAQLLTDAS